MNDYIIETHRLSKYFGSKCVLDNLDLQIAKGGTHAIVGLNGAGKSTLFHILLGLMHPDQGCSKVLGVDSQALTPMCRGQIAYVNDNHTLPPWMHVAALTDLQRSFYPQQWSDTAYQDVLTNFNVNQQQKVNQLSRGERAGLNLALAVGQQPQLLLLDEPTLGLDPVARQHALETILFTNAQDDMTVLYCSHQLEEVERIADTLIVLENGKINCATSADDVHTRVSSWIVQYSEHSQCEHDIPGLLQSRTLEGMWHYTVLDQQDGFADYLHAHQAVTVERIPISLNNAIVDYLSRPNKSIRL